MDQNDDIGHCGSEANGSLIFIFQTFNKFHICHLSDACFYGVSRRTFNNVFVVFPSIEELFISYNNLQQHMRR